MAGCHAGASVDDYQVLTEQGDWEQRGTDIDQRIGDCKRIFSGFDGWTAPDATV